MFDPVAAGEAAAAMDDIGGFVEYAADAYDATAGADAVVIMTEWNEFRSLDLARVRDLARGRVLVDTRNVLDMAQARALGFAYYCTGRELAGAGLVPA